MNFFYETERLYLKVEHQNIAPDVLNFYMENKEFFEPYEITRPDNFYTLAFQSASLALEYNEIVKRHSLRFWIYQKTDPTNIIGSVSAANIRLGGFYSADLGYKIAGNFQNNGFAYEACKKMISILFEEYNLHRITARIMPENYASIHLIEKLHFKYEGMERESVSINHSWEDHARYALLRK